MKKYMAATLLLCGLLNAEALSPTCHRDSDKNVVVCSEAKLGKLMWHDEEQDFQGTWEQAKEYCEQLKFAGFEDWRLPVADELLSIADKNRSGSAINPAFKYAALKWHWSSTKSIENLSEAWVVHLNTGLDYWRDMSEHRFVRCVRND